MAQICRTLFCERGPKKCFTDKGAFEPDAERRMVLDLRRMMVDSHIPEQPSLMVVGGGLWWNAHC